MKKLLSRHNGLEVIFHGDDEGGYIEHRQDVDPILDANRAERNEFRGYKGDGFHKFASIPNVVITKWWVDYGIDAFNPDHAEAVKRLLNDPEWRYLRTTEGTI